jgi:hypothetical protein
MSVSNFYILAIKFFVFYQSVVDIASRLQGSNAIKEMIFFLLQNNRIFSGDHPAVHSMGTNVLRPKIKNKRSHSSNSHTRLYGVQKKTCIFYRFLQVL